MTESKHSPSPWRIELWDVIVVVDANGNVVCDPRRSNAHLIAAAPDLLAVCEALAERGAVIATTGLGDQLRDAIAKAKGD